MRRHATFVLVLSVVACGSSIGVRKTSDTKFFKRENSNALETSPSYRTKLFLRQSQLDEKDLDGLHAYLQRTKERNAAFHIATHNTQERIAAIAEVYRILRLHLDEIDGKAARRKQNKAKSKKMAETASPTKEARSSVRQTDAPSPDGDGDVDAER